MRKQTQKSGKRLYQPIPSILLLERTNFVRLLGYCSCYKQRYSRLERVGSILRNGTERNNGINCGNGTLSQIEACRLPLPLIAATQVIILAVCCFQGHIATIKVVSRPDVLCGGGEINVWSLSHTFL